MLDVIGTMSARDPREHEVDNTSLFADDLYRFINGYVGIEVAPVLFENMPQSSIADPQIVFFPEDPGVFGQNFCEVGCALSAYLLTPGQTRCVQARR
jgi:hypothetical protein